MPKSIIGGWRAFSLLKQADILTAQPVNTLLNFEGDPIEPEPETYFMNDTEVTGELLPTKSRLINRKLQGKHKSKAFPHVVGLFSSMAMGKDTVSGAGPYVHKIEIDKTVVELPYRTMIENDGFAQFVYRGIACSGFMLSGQRGGFVEFEADLIGAAAEATDATAKPARLDESYLAYGEVNLTKGGTFNGTVVSGGTSIAANLVDFKLGFKNGAKGTYLFNDPTGNVGQVRRGSKYEVEFEGSIEIEDQTHRAALLAGTELVFDIPIVGGASAKIQTVLPRVVYREAKKGVDDGILKISAKWGVMSDPTYGGIVMFITNTHTASYLAAA